MPWVWVCAVVFVGLAVVGHRFHGFVVGHRHCGHAVSMVSHWLWVMLWVWVCAVVFMGLAVGFVWWVIGAMVMSWVWWVIGFGSCCGFYFCGCRLIFLGSCGLILVVVVVGCVKWCLISGCHFFFKYLFIFI